MTVTTATQTVQNRAMAIALALAALAVALSITLPLALHSTKTVILQVSNGTPPTTGPSQTTSYDPPTLRAAHGG